VSFRIADNRKNENSWFSSSTAATTVWRGALLTGPRSAMFRGTRRAQIEKFVIVMSADEIILNSGSEEMRDDAIETR
jgi:hypothetical protein